ncbi:hypothetical protein TeGR_g13341 [Tetraparma gracilis]|uniref:Deubiquitinating enzyme MINDY-3/4 conserved domain-containing protein n=1 Tax=Tetraparma gracilis TaxID=2962635 RepID=A0ABQ6MA07_9STRA|nr:hypothetical protein TeGR_g13341 [Tetraparma gracilis]
MSASDLQAVIGTDLETAQMYMEMSGGDLETAVSLFFSMSADTGAPPPSTAPPPPPSGCVLPLALQFLFGAALSSSALPESWTAQALSFTDPRFSYGIAQDKNGPCGVLAALNSIFVTKLSAYQPGVSASPGPDVVHTILRDVVLKCRKSAEDEAMLVVFEGDDVSKYSVVAFPEAYNAEGACDFSSPLGLMKLLLSLVETRGVEQVKAESATFGDTSQPMVSGPFSLCGTELINLILLGSADGNVAAYASVGGGKVPAREDVEVGILTNEEEGVPVADHFKAPKNNVWVVHGGDHFTMLFEGAGGSMFLYNGLQPNRALHSLTMIAGDWGSPAPVAPAEHTPTQYRMEVGCVESIVQAHPDDKKENPTAWRRRRFELCLVNEDMVRVDKATAERPEGVAKGDSYDLGAAPVVASRWRCVSCYKDRFTTYCFGENPPGNAVCKFCGTPAGGNHTIWRTYGELGAGTKARIDRGESKLLQVLRTRWRGCDIAVGGKEIGSEEGVVVAI